ncbi:MAG: dihydrolipoamide succinyltransferase [Rhodospirillales bacterium]|nr:dihydrolipoamide succinyltransferase [Rhodospirillales bacterium]
MATEIKVPTLGESLSEATVANWLKAVGDTVAKDEPLLELETDKVTIEVNAPAAGTLSEIRAATGAEVTVGAILGSITEGAAGAKPAAAKAAPAPAKAEAPKAAPAAAPAPAKAAAPVMAPSAAKIATENQINPASVAGTGKDGRITKGDMLAASTQIPSRPAGPREERVKMSRLRSRIAERLKEAQNTAAMLTTFNEVDMSAVMEARTRYRDSFEKAHGVRLGFMSFFVKASIVALRDFPAVNAEIDGNEIVYKNHYDVGVAVGTENGLVVPVLRDADQMGFADIEKKIGDFGKRARDGKLTLDEMTGGTFTITNGGIYGSMLSTPILNAPQSGILGMHNIVQRPVVLKDGKIEARPIMYVALSYDHRIVDGREAVSFLVRVKDCIEDPQRILFDM